MKTPPTRLAATALVAFIGFNSCPHAGADNGSVSFVRRWHPDGTLDSSFSEIRGAPNSGFAVTAFPESGRLLANEAWNAFSLYREDGSKDPDFRTAWVVDRLDVPPCASLDGESLRLFDGPVVSINGVGVNGGQDKFLLLRDPPQSALQLTSYIRNRDGSVQGQFWVGEAETASIRAIFYGLGPSTAPATVHYTTRDVTATAGKDYVAQSGTITFAALETEKTIQIPILADTEDEFDEILEVVVTAAEGFEALPAPMRLTILGKGPSPRPDRVKRLRDGRVLLGGTGPQETTRLEFSHDLITWHPLTNLLGGFNGESAVWLDPSATNAATRYYRAVAP